MEENVFANRKGALRIIVDNFRFRKDRSHATTITWRCCNEKTDKCKSRCSTNTDITELISPLTKHNHSVVDINTVELGSIRAACKRKVVSTPQCRGKMCGLTYRLSHISRTLWKFWTRDSVVGKLTESQYAMTSYARFSGVSPYLFYPYPFSLSSTSRTPNLSTPNTKTLYTYTKTLYTYTLNSITPYPYSNRVPFIHSNQPNPYTGLSPNNHTIPLR